MPPLPRSSLQSPSNRHRHTHTHSNSPLCHSPSTCSLLCMRNKPLLFFLLSPFPLLNTSPTTLHPLHPLHPLLRSLQVASERSRRLYIPHLTFSLKESYCRHVRYILLSERRLTKGKYLFFNRFTDFIYQLHLYFFDYYLWMGLSYLSICRVNTFSR